METPLNPSHIATIADVALAAKVSIATVSRVKNTSHLVSEEKRRRVFAAMEDLGYPRESQSSAEKNEAQIILLVCSGFHLLEDILEGIIEGAEGLNTEYRVTITYTGFTNEGYRRALELARMLPPELLRGIIFYNNMCDDLSIWAEFQKYPLVQIGEYIKSGNCFAVLTNDHEAMSELTRLLIIKGHRRFVFLYNTYGENRNKFCKDREAGFRASLE
jgi:DNA-binding LacI/PurR family transcriptional regulator